mgnify:CR=1 FL=1
MSQQVITPELCAWIAEQSGAGHPSDSILAAMLGSGWDETVARQALARTLGQAATLTSAPGTTPGLPEPDLSRFAPVIDAGDRAVKVVMALRQPRVVVFGDLLSEEECDGIVALASKRLARSETVASSSDGSEVNAARTSDGMFFERGESDLIHRVETRIATLAVSVQLQGMQYNDDQNVNVIPAATLTDEFDAVRAELLAGPFSEASVREQVEAWTAQIEDSVAEAAELHDDAPSVDAWHAAVDALLDALDAARLTDGR